jgi:hypothetical protein
LPLRTSGLPDWMPQVLNIDSIFFLKSMDGWVGSFCMLAFACWLLLAA